MTRLVPSLALCGALACHRSTPTAPPGAPVAAQPCPPPGAPAIDAELVAIATKPGAAIKAKLRVDAAGAVIKQSLYHNDAAAIPEAVRQRAAQHWPGGTIVRYETEHYAEHGRVHEVEVKTAAGPKCELAIKADGTDLYEECEIGLDAIPAPVAAKIAALFPQGKVLEAESKQGGGIDELTIEIESGGQQYYLRMGADGTVVAKLLRIPAVLEVPVP